MTFELVVLNVWNCFENASPKYFNVYLTGTSEDISLKLKTFK